MDMLIKRMDKYLKNKNYQIGAIVVGVILILGGGFLFLKSSSNPSGQTSNTPAPTQEVIQTIKPEDLGITLTAGPGNKTAVLSVANTQDLVALDYELSYTATVNGAQVARGAIGHIDIKQKGTAVKQSITLGTCSDVCHYDVGVSDIKLTLKINKTDGKTYQANLSLSL